MYKEEHFYNGDGERFLKRTTKLKDKFDEERGYLLYYNGHTVSGLAGLLFPDEMTVHDIANLAMLSRRLVYNANFIGYRSNEEIKPMTPKQIGEVIDTEKRQTYRFLRRMIDLGMMAKVTVDSSGKNVVYYFVNPLYYLNGRNIGDMLYLAFKEQLTGYVPDWAAQRYEERKKDRQ